MGEKNREPRKYLRSICVSMPAAAAGSRQEAQGRMQVLAQQVEPGRIPAVEQAQGRLLLAREPEQGHIAAEVEPGHIQGQGQLLAAVVAEVEAGHILLAAAAVAGAAGGQGGRSWQSEGSRTDGRGPRAGEERTYRLLAAGGEQEEPAEEERHTRQARHQTRLLLHEFQQAQVQAQEGQQQQQQQWRRQRQRQPQPGPEPVGLVAVQSLLVVAEPPKPVAALVVELPVAELPAGLAVAASAEFAVAAVPLLAAAAVVVPVAAACCCCEWRQRQSPCLVGE